MMIGQTFKNRYRVEESLGRGGMAEVYKVTDLQRGVPLAMKVLRDDLAEDRVFLRRFEREAHNLARLQHPNIVRFYGLEQADGLAFMLMDYIDGHTLRKIIFDARGPLPESEILGITRPVCSALHYAHQLGIVHCDIKSANIMRDSAGKVYLTDFGIARMADAATSTLVGVGTPAYMAPELIRGQDPSPRTDIYALGILLYEMLSGGERPFTGEGAQVTGTNAEKVRWQHLHAAMIPLRSHNPKVAPHLEEVVACCLEKDPDKRFATALELEAALHASAPGEPGKSASRAAVEQPVRPKPVRAPKKSAEPLQRPLEVQTEPRASSGSCAWVIGLALFGGLLAIFGAVNDNQSRPQVQPTPSPTTKPSPNIEPAESAVRAFEDLEIPVAGSVTLMSGSHPLVIRTGWSASSMAVLNSNLDHLEWDFVLNGRKVPREHIGMLTETTEDMAIAHSMILVENWQPGWNSAEKNMRITAPINDGWDDFQPQFDSSELNIFVTRKLLNPFVSNWPIVYQENFSLDDGGWWTGSIEEDWYSYTGETRVEDGVYVMEVISSETGEEVLDSNYPSVVTIGDFYMSARVNAERRGRARDCYGIKVLTYYEFDICSDSTFGVFYHKDEGQWLVELTKSSDINTKTENELAVIKQDGKLTFIINGMYQASIEAPEEWGSIGVSVWAKNLPSSFFFDDFVIRMP